MYRFIRLWKVATVGTASRRRVAVSRLAILLCLLPALAIDVGVSVSASKAKLMAAEVSRIVKPLSCDAQPPNPERKKTAKKGHKKGGKHEHTVGEPYGSPPPPPHATKSSPQGTVQGAGSENCPADGDLIDQAVSGCKKRTKEDSAKSP